MDETRDQRRTYSAESLTVAMGEFERMFGLASDEFYALHSADEPLAIPRYERHVWASFYEDVLRLRGEGSSGDEAVMDRVSRSFATAC